MKITRLSNSFQRISSRKQGISTYFYSFSQIISFAKLKNPVANSKIPLKPVIASFVILLLVSLFLLTRPCEQKFLALGESFTLVEEHKIKKSGSSSFDIYLTVYGTNKTSSEILDFFTKQIAEQTIWQKALELVPGGKILTYRSFKTLPSVSKSLWLSEIQYPIQNRATIEIASPPFIKTDLDFPTEVRIHYELLKKDFAKKYFIITDIVFLLTGIIITLVYLVYNKKIWVNKEVSFQ